MTDSEPFEEVSPSAPTWTNWARNGCFWFLIGILAWGPFPLGSNREWSWSLLTLFVAVCWLLWVTWCWATLESQWNNLKRVGIPLTLAGLALVWAIVQALPIVPSDLVHPVWPETANLLHQAVHGAISLDPWATLSEATKLSTYVAVTWIAFTLARNADCAKRLLDAIIATGAFYALYAFTLGLFGIQQFELFYSIPLSNPYLSGPFVQRNSFATFEGLAALTALARLVEFAHGKILASNGFRRWVLTTVQFVLGSGALIAIAAILTISALVASASRAGSFSTLCGLIVMALPFASLIKHGRSRKWALTGAGALIFMLIVLVWISGETLSSRFEDLVDAGGADPMRVALWAAARRMITNAPYFGLGLGTFESAYPMYATQSFPFIMDKAHNDYLEFAAGLGLPAAFCWWGAIVWAAMQMARGIFNRRRDRIYSLTGLGATTLVAVHSLVDFSLQIPAVATTYAVLLGLGLAQSYSTKKGDYPGLN